MTTGQRLPDTQGTWMDVRFEGRRVSWLLNYFDGNQAWSIHVPPTDCVEAIDYIINSLSVVKERLLDDTERTITFVGEEGEVNTEPDQSDAERPRG